IRTSRARRPRRIWRGWSSRWECGSPGPPAACRSAVSWSMPTRSPSAGLSRDGGCWMSESPHMPGVTEEWRPLADRVAANARDFLDGLAGGGRGESAEETVPLLLLETAQMMLAGAQLGASKDVILLGNAEPDIG